MRIISNFDVLDPYLYLGILEWCGLSRETRDLWVIYATCKYLPLVYRRRVSLPEDRGNNVNCVALR